MMLTTQAIRGAQCPPFGAISSSQQRSQKCRRMAAKCTTLSEETPASQTQNLQIISSRRAALLSAAAAAVLTTTTIATTPLAFAEESSSSPPSPSSSVYLDEKDGFSVTIPINWILAGTGAIGSNPNDRYSNSAGLQRVVAWVPPTSSDDVNLAVTVRTPAADFTSLGSFGTAQQWGEGVVTAMDRSYLLKRRSKTGSGLFGKGEEAVTVAKLLEVKESKGQYIVKYTVEREGSPKRVVVSAVSMGVTPRGLRRFFTVNGSCTAETEAEFGDVLMTAVATFQPPTE